MNCGMKMEYLEETSAGSSYHAYSTEKGSSEPGTMNQNLLTGGLQCSQQEALFVAVSPAARNETNMKSACSK